MINADAHPYRCIELSEEQESAFLTFLRREGVIHERYQPPIFPGCIAIDDVVLDRAARLAAAFYRAAKATYDRARGNREEQQVLLRPFAGFPALLRSIEAEPFFLEFFRLDCYLDRESGDLRIIEVNASPGTLPQFACLDRFFSGFLPTRPPPPFVKATPLMVIRAFVRFLNSTGRSDVRSVGLIACDDGSYATLAEARVYADIMRRQTKLLPALCAIERGSHFSLLPGEAHGLTSADEIDALYHHPGGTLATREAFTLWLEDRSIVILPPRSNLIFTNKSFLGHLRSILPSLDGLSLEDRLLLERALLPSFPLCDLAHHRDEVEAWLGIVLKRDLGSFGVQVHLFPFTRGRVLADVLREIREMQRDGCLEGGTWTVQAYVPPPVISCRGRTYGFDLMVYCVMAPRPAVLFSTRPFGEDKSNIAYGGFYGGACGMPAVSP
jgi:hypothetical protein